MAAEVEPKDGCLRWGRADGENFQEYERMRSQALRLTSKKGNDTTSITVVK
jgi:hypothetical protein